MKVKAINRSNKDFIGVILIIICFLGCEPKLLVVPDFPDQCEEQSDFSDTELFISQFKVPDLPEVYDYYEKDFKYLEEMLIKYIKNRNAFKEIYPSFVKKETTGSSYLTMDVEIIPDASYETNYSCLDACVWGISMGFSPGISKTTVNIKITTIAQIRDSKGQILKEFSAEGLTSKSREIYGFPGFFRGEERARKIGELFEESYKKSFNFVSQYISEAHVELVGKITSVDTLTLSDKKIIAEELERKIEKRGEKSEAPTELVGRITPVDTANLIESKKYREELDREIGKRNGRKDAEKDFNPVPSIFTGVGTGCISLGSGLIIEATNYYSSGEEEMTGGTPYYYTYCIGMGLLGTLQSFLKETPSPAPAAFIGKSPEYIESYTNEYRKLFKERQTQTFGLSYIITHGVTVISLFIYSEASTTP
jgi:hypothetical protein